MKPRFIPVKVVAGRIVPENAAMWKFLLSSAERQSKELEICIRQRKTKRSNDQNSLYWKWMEQTAYYLSECEGRPFSSEQIHQYFKEMFLPKEEVIIPGNGREHTMYLFPSTTSLTVKEFKDYLDAIKHYVYHTYGLQLMNLNEQNMMEEK